jgi:hypothetical protein
MILPLLTCGNHGSARSQSSSALGLQPAAAWQGFGHAICDDGTPLAITDFCGSTPGDAKGLACSRAQAACSNRGGVQECDGVLLLFVQCGH